MTSKKSIAYRPLPWSFEVHELSNGLSAIVYDHNGQRVADHLDDCTAELIVRAVNSHADMLAALKLVSDHFGQVDPYDETHPVLAVRAAIAKAEGR